MAGSAVRLLAVLRARSRAPGAGDVDQSKLSAIRRGWAGEEPAGLGDSTGAAVPGAETMVPDPRAGRERVAGAAAAGHGECPRTRGHGGGNAGMAGAGAGASANRLCAG